MKNRRSRNTIHEKYLRYRSDIWGKLGVKQKNNFIIMFLMFLISLMFLVSGDVSLYPCCAFDISNMSAMSKNTEKKNKVKLEYIKINFDSWDIKDLYYNRSTCKKNTLQVGSHPKRYPKNWLDVPKIRILLARKSLRKRATTITLSAFLDKFKINEGCISEDLITISDLEFINKFYQNPGIHWGKIANPIENEILDPKHKGSSFTYLFMLHAIAVDTTVCIIALTPNHEKAAENKSEFRATLRQYVFSCALHVLLLEQLLPEQSPNPTKHKFFLTTARQKLLYCIQHARIVDKKIFKDPEHFFKQCLQYYTDKKNDLVLTDENLYAIDLRFKRYLKGFQYDLKRDLPY